MISSPTQISKPRRFVVGGSKPSTTERSWYSAVLVTAGIIFSIMSALFFWSIISKSLPVWQHQAGFLLTGTRWSTGSYVGLPMILGTLQTSLLALFLAVGVGLGTAISIVFFVPPRLKLITATTVELLAGIPSIVYGVWGILVLAPWMLAHLYPFLGSLGLSFLGSPEVASGPSILTASLVLAVMILPIFISITREVISAVPQDLIEASLSLGATRWQVISKTVLPAAKIGILGAAFLALARATGETVAVALTIGTLSQVQWHLFYPGTTIASWIATAFGESSAVDIRALMALGVVLMAISLSVSIVSRWFISRQRKLLAKV
jgi:phosphate transport system permease protein